VILNAFLLSTALAAPPVRTKPAVVNTPYETVEDWVRDLQKKDPAKRLFAARTIRTELRVALNQSANSPSGSIRADEALARLDDFEKLAAPVCIAHIENADDPNRGNAKKLALSCGDILGMLQTDAAIPALKARAAKENGRLQRRLTRNLNKIEGAR